MYAKSHFGKIFDVITIDYIKPVADTSRKNKEVVVNGYRLTNAINVLAKLNGIEVTSYGEILQNGEKINNVKFKTIIIK